MAPGGSCLGDAAATDAVFRLPTSGARRPYWPRPRDGRGGGLSEGAAPGREGGAGRGPRPSATKGPGPEAGLAAASGLCSPDLRPVARRPRPRPSLLFPSAPAPSFL